MPRSYTRTTAFALLLSLPSTILVKASVCDWVEDFNNYNATASYPMPALSLSEPTTEGPRVQSIVASNDSAWYLMSRYKANKAISDGGMTNYWINTGDTDANSSAGILGCLEHTSTFSLGEFEFSKEVLERSVNDNGDCRTMLGNDCVNALLDKYKQQASESMMRGRCPEGGEWNFTAPEACRDLVDDSLRWNGGGELTGFNLTEHTYANASLLNASCAADLQPLNMSMHGAIGIGGAYNETILFPAPTFWTFLPNRSGVSEYQTSWVEDVHVEVRCMKPSEIAQGSLAPASVETVLEDAGVKYDKDIKNGGGRLGGERRNLWSSVVGVGVVAGVMLW